MNFIEKLIDYANQGFCCNCNTVMAECLKPQVLSAVNYVTYCKHCNIEFSRTNYIGIRIIINNIVIAYDIKSDKDNDNDYFGFYLDNFCAINVFHSSLNASKILDDWKNAKTMKDLYKSINDINKVNVFA